MKLRKNRIFLVVFIWLMFLNIVSRQVSITVTYDPVRHTEPIGLTTLYYNNGNGFEETDSVYETVEGNQVTYSFQPSGIVCGLRVMPMRDGVEEVFLSSMTIAVDGSNIRTLEGEALYQAVLRDRSAARVAYKDGLVKVGYRKGEPWPYMTLRPSAWIFANGFGWKTCGKAVLGVLLLMIASGFRIPFIKRRTEAEYEPSTRADRLMDGAAFGLASTALVFELGFLLSREPSVVHRGIDRVILIACIWLASRMLSHIRDDKSGRKGKAIRTIFLTVTVTFALYEMMKLALLSSGSYKSLLTDLLNRMTTPVYLMNLFWGCLFLSILYGLVGNIGYCLYGLIWLVVFAGNGIKIHYHNTLLTPVDFLQLEEMFRIAKTMLGTGTSILICVVVLAVLALLFVTRKKWMAVLKPSFRIGYILLPGLLCVGMSKDVLAETYMDRNIFYKSYENEFVNERYDGVVFYNLINLSKVDEMIMEEPSDYDRETVQALKEGFEHLAVSEKTDLRPNVILIMAESLFDIESVEGVTFDCEIEPTLRAYGKGSLISPRYGGYTSAIEYEALTGLSLAFYPPALVPYTTYFNQAEKQIPSIAYEFKKNGYRTLALHPNDKTFYNRDIAYQMLGFDEFLSKPAFTYTDENVVAGTFLKDMPVAEKITELIESQDEPLFLFATTIAGHYMKEDRYQDPGVTAYHASLDEADLQELEQAAAAYKETDEMFRYLVEFMQASEEPTLLYIFGDHLPPMPVLTKLNYPNSFEKKYSTVLSAFSNFREIDMPESITPNQLAAQLMVDSGIEYSGYYDYIYSLRTEFPVLHLEQQNAEQMSKLDTYRMIQYDIMFGNHWFFEEERGEK